MSSVSHQTIKLSTGRHSSPEVGACVMELASMLAGEPFTDQPESVCPVIGSFLRAYNDVVDDRRRQDLYAYASKVVGSTRSAAVQRARADRLATWALEMRQRRRTRWFVPRCLRGIGAERHPPIDVLGLHAARSISRPTADRHAAALAVIDELLALDGISKPAARERVFRGQVPTLELDRQVGAELSFPADACGSLAARTQVEIPYARGEGLIVDGDTAPFHGALVRPASGKQVRAWLTRSTRAGAKLRLGELALIAGAPCSAEAGGLIGTLSCAASRGRARRIRVQLR
jgi:hypothetical protein